MENKKLTRDYGLDIVRIISMLGIVILHVNGAGGVLDCCKSQQASASYWIAFWIEIITYTSVDIFGLLSGYLGIYKKKVSCYRILELMECASLAACAQFRNIIFGQLLFTADSLANMEAYDTRNWGNRHFGLAMDLAMDAAVEF